MQPTCTLEAALELAESLDDAGLRAEALAVLASDRFRAGVTGALQLAEEAAALAEGSPDPRLRMRVGLQVAIPLVWSFRLENARALLTTIEREWGELDERATADALWLLGMVEFRAGRFQLAADYAERSREIGRQYATDEQEEPTHLWLIALIAAHRGEVDRARVLAERARVLAAKRPVIRAGQDGVLGLLALWSGDPGGAAACFATADDARRGTGVREPALFWWHAERVEALLALGRVDEAAGLVDAWEADAGTPRPHGDACPCAPVPRADRGSPRKRGRGAPGARTGGSAARERRRCVRTRAHAAHARRRPAASTAETSRS